MRKYIIPTPAVVNQRPMMLWPRNQFEMASFTPE